MHTEKRNSYKLAGGIHAITIKTKNTVTEWPQDLRGCIKKEYGWKPTSLDEKSMLTINMDKYFENCLTATGFQETLKEILCSCKIDDFTFVRTEFQLTNCISEYSQAFDKLNKYLLSSLLRTCSLRKTYIPYDMVDMYDKFTFTTKGQGTSCGKCEDKSKIIQSHLVLKTGAREWQNIYREANNVKLDKNLLRQSLEAWIIQLDAALNHLDETQKVYNDELELIYRELKQYKVIRVRSVIDFILRFHDCIFTKKQLIDLYERLEPNSKETATKKATYFKREYGIEFFSKNDMKYAVSEIKRTILEFLEK